MRNLFDPADRQSTPKRLRRLEPGAARQGEDSRDIDLRQFDA
jgi:hypothetical protein